jgi:hypothetical protein
MAAPSLQQLRDLTLVESVAALGALTGGRLRINAAALRLQSFSTGIERCVLQISRVLNGGTPGRRAARSEGLPG